MAANNPLTRKNEIISLLLADMRNRKLLMGLEAAGLGTDDFHTNLEELIFSKMQIPKQHKVRMLNWYEDRMYRLLDVDLHTFRTHQIFLALRMYDAIEERKMQLQAHVLLKPEEKFPFLKWIGFGRFDN